MDRFVGHCRGGPKDGKCLEHDLPYYHVVIGNLPKVNFVKPDEELKYGTYFWDYAAGRWQWHG
jgi:hypothetical protein